MEIRDYARALRRHWLAIVLMTVVGLAAAFGWAQLQTPVYQANAGGSVQARSTASDPSLAPINDGYARNKVPTYLQMAMWRSTAQHAIDELGLKVTPDQLVKRITVDNPEGTSILNITATGPTAKAARDLAEAWVRGLVATIDTNEGVDGKPDTSPVTVVLAESAALPSAPVFPSVQTALLVGGVLGLGGGIAFALMRAVSDRRVRATDEVEERLGIPVVGTIPKVAGVDTERRIDLGDDGNSRVGFAVREALRVLRTNLQFIDVDRPPRVIVVTSALPGEGKSTVAANLAMTLAASGARVVLVDGDLRRPTVARTMGVAAGAGLTDVLVGRANLNDVLQRSHDSRSLVVLTAGTIPPNPSEVLGSDRMKQLVRDLAEHATVIIDAPPLLAVTDSAVLTSEADGALIVVTVGKTTYDLVERAVGALHKVRGRVLGVVLNRAPTAGVNSSVYTYQYTEEKGKSARAGRKAHQRDAARKDAVLGDGSDSPVFGYARREPSAASSAEPDFDSLLRDAATDGDLARRRSTGL